MAKRKLGINATGYKEYRKYLRGNRLTMKEAIIAKCYECCCGYVDGCVDCECDSCPLYNFMPFRKKRKKK